MKKLIFSAIALVAFCSGTFANSVEFKEVELTESLVLIKQYSGTAVVMDSCGNEWNVTFSCGDCTPGQIGVAVVNYFAANGGGCTYASGEYDFNP